MRTFTVFPLLVVLAACAQVPKETVELSNTVGRDIAEIERSHRAFVNLYYDQMERSANRFVDEVYMAYLIGETLKDPEVGGALAEAIKEAGQPGANDQTKKDTFEAMGYYFISTRTNIENFRKKTIAPLQSQRREILQAIEAAYLRVKEGNSTVTAYLASVVKVTDEQNKLLAKAGLPDLQSQIATKADKFNKEIGALNEEAGAIKDKLKDTDKLKSVVEKGQKILDELSK
jgi:hypothetical protein